MPTFRRPQPTVLPGLGVAGAVLAAVVVTFALASGIVAYGLTSEDPLGQRSDALVLDPLRARTIAATPLVLGGARAPASSAGASTSATVARAGGRGAVHGSLFPQDAGRGADGVPQRGGDGPAVPEHIAQTLPVRVRKPLGPTIHAVHGTTDLLAGGRSAMIAALGTRTEVIARTAGVALGNTGDALRNAAGRTGRAVARPLDGQPAR